MNQVLIQNITVTTNNCEPHDLSNIKMIQYALFSIGFNLAVLTSSLKLKTSAHCMHMKSAESISAVKAIGFDFGTSGVRCCSIDNNACIVHEESIKWSNSDIFNQKASLDQCWTEGLHYLLSKIPISYRQSASRICLSGTSGSVLMYNSVTRKVSLPPRMYNYDTYSTINSSPAIINKVKTAISQYCPKNHPASLPSSTLPKFLAWHFENKISLDDSLCHQADFLAHQLCYPTESSASVRVLNFSPFVSDWHNSLKLGYDVKKEEYPLWLLSLISDLGYNPLHLLPRVIQPGTEMGGLNDEIILKYGFSNKCKVIAGTTDSIAAFLAAGVDMPGQAVTSLGSTLAVKLLSEVPVEDSARGIYSHRLGDLWLVGGASNTGCLVLKNEGFSDSDLSRLSELINPNLTSGLHYYPLSGVGERFPISDPHKQPVLSPKPILPDDSAIFTSTYKDTLWRKMYLHGILEGIARIEKEAYDAFRSLGATPVTEVLTCGGGSKNDKWTEMRQHMLHVPTKKANNVEASYGCALLALRSLSLSPPPETPL